MIQGDEMGERINLPMRDEDDGDDDFGIVCALEELRIWHLRLDITSSVYDYWTLKKSYWVLAVLGSIGVITTIHPSTSPPTNIHPQGSWFHSTIKSSCFHSTTTTKQKIGIPTPPKNTHKTPKDKKNARPIPQVQHRHYSSRSTTATSAQTVQDHWFTKTPTSPLFFGPSGPPFIHACALTDYFLRAAVLSNGHGSASF
jgi:hypothetical protein